MAGTESLGAAGVEWLERLAGEPADRRRLRVPTIAETVQLRSAYTRAGADLHHSGRVKRHGALPTDRSPCLPCLHSAEADMRAFGRDSGFDRCC